MHAYMPRSKRSKLSSDDVVKDDNRGIGQHSPLLPGLPDHLAQLCLSSLPPSLLFRVSRGWRRLLYSPAFPPFLSLYALLCPSSEPDRIQLAAFDPISGKWDTLSPPPLPRLLLSHPSFLSRALPVQSVTADNRLAIVSATTHGLSPAIPRPLIFTPADNLWHLGPAFSSPRRWCAVGSANGSLYVASGVGTEYSSETARSVERLDLSRPGSGWRILSPLRDGRFSREETAMVFSNGKLCIVNAKGKGAKEGIMYDVRSDSWMEMPNGLLTGWTGPAAAVEEGGDVFMVDEASGALRRYEWGMDTWAVVIESERLKGATGIAGGGGRVCVTCEGGTAVAVVDVAGKRVWTVLPPEGTRVVALHVLPRMNADESCPLNTPVHIIR